MSEQWRPAELGSLPSDWRVAALREVVDRHVVPVAPTPRESYREIGIRSHGKGIFHKDPVKGAALGAKRVFEVAPNQLVFNIVFAWEGAVAVTSENERGMIASHRFPMFTGKPGLADVQFLRRFFQTELGVRLLGEASPGGAGRNRTLNQKFAGEIPVPVPPIAEQQKIAAILSSVDDAIEAAQAVIDQLKIVKQAMMAGLLTRGFPGRHTRFKQTEIGEVPETWHVRPIQALVLDCDYGLSKALRASGDGVAVLRMSNLQEGRVVLRDLKFIDAREVASDLLLARGDVLFNRTNSKDLVGKVGLFEGSEAPVSFASYLLRLRPDPRVATGSWLSAVMNLDANQAALRSMATPGVSQVNVNRTKMLSLTVPVPSLDEQHELVTVLQSVTDRIATEGAARDGLRHLKACLMSVLLTGEVRVKPDEEAS